MLLQFPKCNLKSFCFLRCAVAPVSYRRSLPLHYFGLFQCIVLNFRRLFWSNYLISKPPRFSYNTVLRLSNKQPSAEMRQFPSYSYSLPTRRPEMSASIRDFESWALSVNMPRRRITQCMSFPQLFTVS